MATPTQTSPGSMARVRLYRESDFPRRQAARAVTGDGDEIYRDRDAELAQQIGEKYAGPFEDADQVHALALAVALDLPGDRTHALANLRPAEQYLELFRLALLGHDHPRTRLLDAAHFTLCDKREARGAGCEIFCGVAAVPAISIRRGDLLGM